LFIEEIPPAIERKDLLSSNVLGTTSSCLVDLRVLRRLGGFDPNLTSCQDWDLWLKLASEGQIVVCQEPLTIYYNDGPGRISRNARAVIAGHKQVMDRIIARWAKPTERYGLRLAHQKIWVSVLASLGLHHRAFLSALYLSAFSTSFNERRNAVRLAAQAVRSTVRQGFLKRSGQWRARRRSARVLE
jgi:hypothetical protein